MPTTDPRIAFAALDSLRAAQVGFALLQPPDALLSSKTTGDIDIVVSTPPPMALKRAWGELRSRRIIPAALWHYDVGGTATSFFFDPSGTRGAQVDMLYDPNGIGHYSIRSRALLESALPADPFPTVSPLELAIYLFSKRSRKQQEAKLRALRAQIDSAPKPQVIDAVRRIVTSNGLAMSITGQSLGLRSKPRTPILRLERLRDRLSHPVGFWVHCRGDQEDLARSLADQIGAVLVRSTASRLPGNTMTAWRWYWQVAQPVRLRPGIVVSWGPASPIAGPRPDLIVGGGRETADVGREVIAAMSRRVDQLRH